ncbi:hypothetical protein BGZ65_008594, partial [Modicella reniformis]
MGVDLEEKVYNIQIALNLENLKIDEIESISFSQRHGEYFGGLEIFARQELKHLSATSKQGILVLGLHRQFCIERKSEVQAFDMEIRTSNNPSPTNDPGCIVLHYMEFHEFQMPIVDHDTVQLHQPFLWSIDASYEDDLAESRTVLTRIICYAVSGDGNYVATLSTKDKSLHLDVWDLEMNSPHIVNSEDAVGK